jgi:hypothetical protein
LIAIIDPCYDNMAFFEPMQICVADHIWNYTKNRSIIY